jgi:DNA repair protein RadA/Sms
MSEGIDNRRLILLAAVIEKFLGMKLVECDIFSNLAGGLSIDEPALDMAICISIISSYREIKVPASTAVLGEVGLSGEVRPVSNISARVKELQSLGIQKIFIPNGNQKELEKQDKSQLILVSHLREFELVF